MFFNTPLRAPGSAPKKGEGFLDSLGEARTTVVTGVAMFLVIAATWAAGYVDLPLPGLMVCSASPYLPRGLRPRCIAGLQCLTENCTADGRCS